ncbi:unnamed protein product [Spirodela intermedia]|uniref:RING-type E3 ubiquitin transferase n=1 Tax=Spirodela intermedia TaxID=51605 RepID=A0A7I8JHT5_SPIIN|nr:unnamed protein product [Spirodela intermedia]CAA6669670.1 unnamed protein product [Spirodela intermedia]
MGSPNYNQQTGLQIDDCSLGFCSVYCPQWCFIVQKPPPPFGPPEDAAASPGFSPLFIIVIGILASAFMLILYYAVITRYCSRFDPSGGDGAAAIPPPPPPRLESLIRSLGEIKFVNGEGIVGTCDCSVCLGEFQEGEALRLLPKCTHAFHLPCIDMWLRSHSTCPLCRTNVVAPPVQPTSSPELQREAIATDPKMQKKKKVVAEKTTGRCRRWRSPPRVGGSHRRKRSSGHSAVILRDGCLPSGPRVQFSAAAGERAPPFRCRARRGAVGGSKGYLRQDWSTHEEVLLLR